MANSVLFPFRKYISRSERLICAKKNSLALKRQRRSAERLYIERLGRKSHECLARLVAKSVSLSHANLRAGLRFSIVLRSWPQKNFLTLAADDFLLF